MDSLMPFIIIIYLLFSVIAAVLKAISASKQVQQKEMAEKSAARALVTDVPKTEQPIQDRVRERFQQVDAIRRKTPKGKPKENSNLDLAHQMRKVLVMSELLREPRSRRPWPER